MNKVQIRGPGGRIITTSARTIIETVEHFCEMYPGETFYVRDIRCISPMPLPFCLPAKPRIDYHTHATIQWGNNAE